MIESPAETPAPSPPTTSLGWWVVGVTTVIVVIGSAVVLLFNPIWIGFEQQRAGVPAITGYTPEQVRAATGSILADLIFGPPDFAVTIVGQPVLDDAERSHMVDVRNVLLPFAMLLVVATVVLVAIVAANRRNGWVWRAIARASGTLLLVGVVVGAAVLLFFDAAFLLFHRVFFPQGNFSFDPRVERLTQLFPPQFWTETATATVIVALAIALAVTLVARRQAGRMSA